MMSNRCVAVTTEDSARLRPAPARDTQDKQRMGGEADTKGKKEPREELGTGLNQGQTDG